MPQGRLAVPVVTRQAAMLAAEAVLREAVVVLFTSFAIHYLAQQRRMLLTYLAALAALAATAQAPEWAE
jgi:hypothetical protein